MGFNANLTMTGLCLLITDDPKTPKFAELLILGTSDMKGNHRHYPYMSFLYDNRGNLEQPDQPSLPGWGEYIIGPDGRAITRVLLENTIIRIRAKTDDGKAPAFVRDASMEKVPDLSRLGVTAVTQPGRDRRIDKVTSRIALPAGTLFTTGDVADKEGPIKWERVGVIAELAHLQLRGLSELTVDHGGNSFSLEPIDGSVDLSISNEPTTVPLPVVDDERNLVLVPHFYMFERLADHRPELARAGKVTPGNPACPTASWVQANWPFLVD